MVLVHGWFGRREKRPAGKYPGICEPPGGGKEGGGSVEGDKVSAALREKRTCALPAPEAWFSFVVGRMRFWIL